MTVYKYTEPVIPSQNTGGASQLWALPLVQSESSHGCKDGHSKLLWTHVKGLHLLGSTFYTYVPKMTLYKYTEDGRQLFPGDPIANSSGAG